LIAFSAHLSTLFPELPLAERPQAALAAGFGLVESWWPPAAEADPFALAVARSGLEVSCLNCFGGDLAAGERGFLNHAGRHARTLADFEEAVAYGDRLGARTINVLVGRALPETPLRRQLDTVVSTLRDISAVAGRAGVTVLVEPLNELDIPGSLVATPEAAVALIEEVGSDSVALLYDAYHALAAGRRPELQVRELAALVGHVQVADVPGRTEPGSGRLGLGALLEALEETGYDGAVGFEFVPTGATPSLEALLAPYDRAMGGRR
jgi:hydroxypyruvate isomerase